MIVFFDGKRFVETRYEKEADFEAEVVASHKTLFGPKAVYVNAKQKIDAKALGGSIPDGFLFNLADIDNPEFYLVEVELASHDFYRHIFPQLTKFFAFFKNPKSQAALIEKLYTAIGADNGVRQELKSLLGDRELHKFLRDVVIDSQNILLIMDDTKAEMDEVIDIYTDTWGKMVKPVVLRRYVADGKAIFTMEPEFEGIEFAIAKPDDDNGGDTPHFSEEYHLEGANESVRQILARLKEITSEVEPTAVFNPQKYYISIKYRRNVAYLEIRKSKIRMVTMLPEKKIKTLVKSYSITAFSPSVQKFYGRPCAAINIVDAEHLNEIRSILGALIADTDLEMTGRDDGESATL